MSMFGNSGNKETNTKKTNNTVPTSHAINTMVGGTLVEGDVTAQNDFRIDGKLVGNLDCSGKVIVGPDGVIEGSIKCANAIIEGQIKGDISVADLLTVMDSGNIVGNIKTDRLIVHAGAKFNVNCDMDGTRQVQKPVKKESSYKDSGQKIESSKGLVFDA
jgi:cytoskeletal protein CcmA (bactofilin family)